MSADLHQRLTATILAQLETADPASWTPPWHGADPSPRNALTGRRYRGVNTLALWCTGQAHGFIDPRWATYRQWAALGAQVRRQERGSLVLFYRDLPDRAATASAPGTTSTNDDRTLPRFVARASYVFNAQQVENAPAPIAPAISGATTDPLSAFESFVAATGAVIHEGGSKACYVPSTDTIRLPARAAFISAQARAATLSHELVHWTGATHRLARDLTGRFDTHAYAAEELIAELGAAFLLAELELARHPHPDHAAYLAGWLRLLRTDPRALATAAAHGSRAADYLLALQSEPGPDHSSPPLVPLRGELDDATCSQRTGIVTARRRAA